MSAVLPWLSARLSRSSRPRIGSLSLPSRLACRRMTAGYSVLAGRRFAAVESRSARALADAPSLSSVRLRMSLESAASKTLSRCEPTKVGIEVKMPSRIWNELVTTASDAVVRSVSQEWSAKVPACEGWEGEPVASTRRVLTVNGMILATSGMRRGPRRFL